MRKFWGVSAAVLTGVVLLGCGFGDSDPDGDGANVVEDNGDNGTGENANGANGANGGDDAVGTRGNPVEPGVAFTVGEWVVEFGDVTRDAGDIVAEENQFNDPPADGRQFVMTEVTVTYDGDDSGMPWVDLSFQFYGSEGNTFSTGSDDRCGVIPDSLSDEGEMFPGATASGNVCLSVPSDQLDGGAWIVEDTFTLDADRVFVALS